MTLLLLRFSQNQNTALATDAPILSEWLVRVRVSTGLQGVDEHFSPGSKTGPDAEDPPLCADLEKFIHGAAAEDLSHHFAVMVEGLARVRIQDMVFVKSLHFFTYCPHWVILRRSF